MEYRLADLLYVLLLGFLFVTSGGLLLYAIWNIGMQVMRAMHVFLTCWDYQRASRNRDHLRHRVLVDPITRGILRGTSPIQIFCPFFAGRRRQLRRLEDYRLAKLRKTEADLVWDDRLTALLTRDEYDFLYAVGTPPPPAATTHVGCPDRC